MVFSQLKFNICVSCDMAFIAPMHCNKPNITYMELYLRMLRVMITGPHIFSVVFINSENWILRARWSLLYTKWKQNV